MSQRSNSYLSASFTHSMDDKKVIADNVSLNHGHSSSPADSGSSVASIGPNFEVLESIGEGAIGIVFKAKHLLLNKIVAIKVLKDEYSSQSKVFLRFQHEARTTSQLSHQNIASVHDFGLTESGHPFIVMDYIQGQTLSDLIEKNGALPEREAYPIFQQICRALIHAHEKGVIHRDLKPSNIILEKQASGEYLVKVVDFGIAKVIAPDGDSASPKLTQTGEIFGTPLYMSPEQCKGLTADHRTDLYSLGCVMYETLMGSPPFNGENTFAVLIAQVSQAPAPFSESNKAARVADAMERLVFRAMEKEPADRYQAAQSILNDLESINDMGATVAPSKQYSKPRRAKLSKLVLFGVGAAFLISFLVLAASIMSTLNLANYPWSATFKEALQLRTVNPEAAEADFRKAISIAEGAHASPQQIADIEYELAVMLFLRDIEDHEAYTLFARVAQVEPHDTLRHTNTLDYLARAEISESNRVFLASERERAQGAAPDKVQEFLAEQENLKRLALEHATESVDLKIALSGPENGYVEDALRSRGRVLYAEGMYADAEKDFLKALAIATKLNIGDAEAARCLDLAQCYAAMGKIDDARRFYERSINKYKEVFGPDHRQVKDVITECNDFMQAHR